MDGRAVLAREFEANRAHLRAVAFRMLGSMSEADDAVQETWLKASRAQYNDVRNLAGWLTTIISRVCLDMLRARVSRREEPWESHQPDAGDTGINPEQEMVQADSVGLALLVVLETLAPAERLAFVLHDMFAVPFEEIAPIVGRTPTATRQLASRARRRVQGTNAAGETDLGRQREIVGAFLAASRGGDFGALLAVLDPDVVLHADRAAVAAASANAAQGAPVLQQESYGADAIAAAFLGRAQEAQLALIDGFPGAIWQRDGVVRSVFRFMVLDSKIVEMEVIHSQASIRAFDIVVISE